MCFSTSTARSSPCSIKSGNRENSNSCRTIDTAAMQVGRGRGFAPFRPQKVSRKYESPAFYSRFSGQKFGIERTEAEETCRWSIEWAFAKKDFSDLVIPKPAADILRFDEGRAASWVEGDRSRWTAFFLKWVAGPSRSGTLARGHRPEVCLPASGYQLRAGRGTITVEGYSLESGTFGPGSQDSNPPP
jgi:hypothetical protein